MVGTEQRFTKGSPCPVCGGYGSQERGRGKRCHGFLSDDGEYAHCTREDHAGGLPFTEGSGTFAHRLVGDCRCGVRHDPQPEGPRPHAATSQRRIATTYDYRDADGALVYQVVRFAPKGFSQRRPDGRGGWHWNLNGVERVPYRLPELLAADSDTPIYVVEGEKDADNLAALGLVATSAGGALKWRDEYGGALRGRHVIILPDNDEPGRQHAAQVEKALLGVAASVRVLDLPDLPAKGDVSDWLGNGGTAEALADMAGATPVVDARFAAQGASEHRESRLAEGFAPIPLAELLAEHEEGDGEDWLVEGLLPSGGSSLIVAKPKVGKSTLVRNLALDVARGESFLGRSTERGVVLYLALEEKRSRVREHFASMGASETEQLPVFVHVGPAPASDPLAHLRELLAAHRPALAIIDPLQRFLRLKDGNDYAQVSSAIEPLHDLARTSGCHIACVHHANKGGQGSDGVLGSTAFFAGVDTLLNLKKVDGQRTIESQQRYGDDLPETRISLDEATGRILLGVTSGEVHRRDVGAAILAAVRDGAVTEVEIRKAVGGDQTEVARELRSLADGDGSLVREGAGKKGSPYRFRLRSDEPNRPRRIRDARSDTLGGSDHRGTGLATAHTPPEDEPDEEVMVWVG